MASTALSRVTGVVLAYDKREGTISKGPRVGERYVIETANILVANTNVTVVQLPRRDENGRFSKLESGVPNAGEYVDYLVETSIYQQDVQVRVLADFPVEHTPLVAA